MAVKHGSHGSDNCDPTSPDLGLTCAEIALEQPVMNFAQLRQNLRAFLPVHRYHGAEILHEEDSVAPGGVQLSGNRGLAQPFEQARLFLLIEATKKSVLSEIGEHRHFAEAGCSHNANRGF